MPLTTFLCVDGNLESRVVAFALIPDESKETYEQVLVDFSECCPVLVSSFMIDKSMAEIAAIESIFPNTAIELCHFHALEAFRRKISSLQCDASTKEELRQIVVKLCECRSLEVYEKLVDELRGKDCDFWEYFEANWNRKKERWVMFAQQTRVNFGGRTTNRLESFHQKLKSEVARLGSLDSMFRNIMLVIDN
jgi:transposase-like protein